MKNQKSVYLAWRAHYEYKTWAPIGRLDRWGKSLYFFSYTKGADQVGFRPFPGMENIETVYRSNTMFSMFSNRLLDSKREEYQSVLNWSGFDDEIHPDPLAILEVTEGRRSTDYFEVFPLPIPDGQGLYNFRFFLHGIERLSDIAKDRVARLRSGDRLLTLLDVQNSYDSNAVALRTKDDRQIVGYLPRYLAQDFSELSAGCGVEYVSFEVNRLNSDAPLQFRVLCDLQACWPDEYVPFRTPAFEPIVNSGGAAQYDDQVALVEAG